MDDFDPFGPLPPGGMAGSGASGSRPTNPRSRLGNLTGAASPASVAASGDGALHAAAEPAGAAVIGGGPEPSGRGGAPARRGDGPAPPAKALPGDAARVSGAPDEPVAAVAVPAKHRRSPRARRGERTACGGPPRGAADASAPATAEGSGAPIDAADPRGEGFGPGAGRAPGYRLSVKEMAPDERPRERLKLRGPQALSDGDLLAILLNTGIVGESVIDVAQRVLAEHGGLRGLMQMEVAELAAVRGLGDAKAVRLKAALELGRRLAALSPEARPQVTAPDDVANLLAIEMAALPQEQLRAVLLDTKHRVLAIRTVYQGTVNQAQVRVAEVFRDAIRQNAVALVAVHNHPSGDPTPSAADVALTAELCRAGQLLGIDLLDHLVIGQGRWVSLRRLGLGFPPP